MSKGQVNRYGPNMKATKEMQKEACWSAGQHMQKLVAVLRSGENAESAWIAQGFVDRVAGEMRKPPSKFHRAYWRGAKGLGLVAVLPELDTILKRRNPTRRRKRKRPEGGQ